MSDPFAAKVETWHDFYLLVGTAAATLIGLLFIAMTIRGDVLSGKEYGAMRALARQSFACFLNLLTIAGVMLIPDQSMNGVGIPLVCIGGISACIALRQTMHGRHEAGWSGLGVELRRTGLILVGTTALIGLGIGLWTGHDGLLDWMTAVVLTLLSAASHNAWELLTNT